MGANKSKVIGPSRKDIPVPQISVGKQRLTVMYCGNASGQMMPPFFVFPEPKPRAYDPLNGVPEGSYIAYTKKGWMDGTTFSKFIDHFDKFAGVERPVVLLLDSVGSHISQKVFVKAKEKDIELYRIVSNETHLMQPLDKGVFEDALGKR
ncbi:jerky protein-like [Ruditapes philippinarum]|uniref:jerky protein-like n=1 Tax=Ruditapes philippinarum TaxID=129788 RepID=UPI00295BDDA8|nr:jerky protein-like [Ruditapes philippinarum]